MSSNPAVFSGRQFCSSQQLSAASVYSSQQRSACSGLQLAEVLCIMKFSVCGSFSARSSLLLASVFSSQQCFACSFVVFRPAAVLCVKQFSVCRGLSGRRSFQPAVLFLQTAAEQVSACPIIISSVATLQALKHGMKNAGTPSRKLDARSKSAVTALNGFFRIVDKILPPFRRLFTGSAMGNSSPL